MGFSAVKEVQLKLGIIYEYILLPLTLLLKERLRKISREMIDSVKNFVHVILVFELEKTLGGVFGWEKG